MMQHVLFHDKCSDVNYVNSILTESSDSTTDTVEKRDALKSCIKQPDDVRRSSRLRKQPVKFKDCLGLPETENKRQSLLSLVLASMQNVKCPRVKLGL